MTPCIKTSGSFRVWLPKWEALSPCPRICNGWSCATAPALLSKGTSSTEPNNLKAHTSCYNRLPDGGPGASGQWQRYGGHHEAESRPPHTCGPPSARIPGPPSAASGRWSARTSTTRTCAWLPSAEPAPSCAARSPCHWRGSRLTPPRAPEHLPPKAIKHKVSDDFLQPKKKKKSLLNVDPL